MSYAVADIWMMIYVIFARVSCAVPGRVRYVWILFRCGYIRFMIYSLYSVCVYIQDTIKIVLCYCVLI